MSEEVSKESAAEVDFTAARQQYVDNRDKEVVERHNRAAGYFSHQFDALLKQIATNSESPLDAYRAVAHLLEVLGNGFEKHGDTIANRITSFITDNPTIPVDQIQELETRVTDAEERANQAELDRSKLEASRRDLQRSAQRASSLELRLSTANSEVARLQAELDQAQGKINELEAELDKPNPLSQQVNDLRDENARLKNENVYLVNDNNELKKQIELVEDGEGDWSGLLKRVAPERFDDMGRWVERPRDSKREDPTPAPDPTPTPAATPAPQAKPSTRRLSLPGRRKKEN